MPEVRNLEFGRDEGATDRGWCVLCEEWEKLLKCTKTRRWREEFLDKKWTNMNEEIAFREY
jgi:hypothetical protein